MKTRIKRNSLIIALLLVAGSVLAREYHVAKYGNDTNTGTASNPFLTIQQAANLAQPGDVITVHEGVYRERVNPPHGGTSDDKHIIYQATPGEKVIIKGSEQVKGWKKMENDTWMVKLPNSYFGNFNPYSDVISGDWYQAKQAYHTGAVYVNGHWLKESPRKSYVVESDATEEESKLQLMNIEFLQPSGGHRIPSSSFSLKHGSAAVLELSEGRTCVGSIKDGDWLAYEEVDFGNGSNKLVLNAASPEGGALVEIRMGSAEGELLGKFDTGITAEWTHFQPFHANIDKKLSGKHTIVLVFKARPVNPTVMSGVSYWFSLVGQDTTTIWAQFKGVDPNKALVEINVRQTVFYPEKPGLNYITVRGFTLEQAATPWSPPTAEQIGLIGTHWSKGWIIESNTIRYSACSGLTLGKHGDEFDNTYEYYRTIKNGVEKGWNRETIGHHLVRNNHILNCGQGGIIGSLGCAFSTITGNEIHDIRKDHQYGGCETAGIKLHGAIDVVISRNHIYNCEHWGGIWLDWMGQGARITGNLLHNNSNDLMCEMNHGPMLIDNNLFLSSYGLRDASGGGAYVHNLWQGDLTIWSELSHRKTPFFKPHSIDLIEGEGMLNEKGENVGLTADQNDDRFFNNLFVCSTALSLYDNYKFQIEAAGNVFLSKAKPSIFDRDPLVVENFVPGIKLMEKTDGWWLEMNVDTSWQAKHNRSLVTSKLLGRAKVPDAPYEQPDGTPYRIDTDYFGEQRNVKNPAPGPFRAALSGKVAVKVWPRN
jgi:alpha-N-arabinofuranosidase